MQPTDDPDVQRVSQLTEWVSQLTVKFPPVDFGIHGKEIIHIPDHRQLPSHVTNVFVVQSKVFTVQ